MKLSVVTTMYQSAAYLREFHSRVTAAVRQLSGDYEVIYVNDGSPDDSLDVAVSIHEADGRVKVVDLSRNFGHHKAIMTGLSHARGDLVFLLDCDLEEPPEALQLFAETMQRENADVVFGVQEVRKGDWFERFSGWLFYKVVNRLSYCSFPRNVVTARLMTRRYVAALTQHRDREVFLLGLWTITGFKQVPVPVKKLSKGSSAYDFGRKMGVLLNAVTSFSNKPLVFVFHLGWAISLCAGIAALVLIVRRLFCDAYLGGWPSLIVSVWLLGGLTILCLGIIGIYLAKVFTETKDRPYTVVRRVYERPAGGRHEL